MNDAEQDDRPRLRSLVRRVPELVARLVRDEIESAKAEVSTKLKAAVAGIAVVVVGAVLALYGLGWLIAAGVSALALVLPHWLASLIVGAALLLIAGIAALVGVGRLRRGAPPIPSETVDSVRRDVRAVKGTGR